MISAPGPRWLLSIAASLLLLGACDGTKATGGDGSAGASGSDGAGGAGGNTGSTGDAAGADGTGDTSVPGAITCGTTTCSAPSLCCRSDSDSHCTTDSTPGNCVGGTGTLASCDGPEDCDAGKVCCFVQPGGMNPGPPSVACSSSTACLGGGNGASAVVCHDGADCPTSVPVCCPSSNEAFPPTCATVCR